MQARVLPILIAALLWAAAAGAAEPWATAGASICDQLSGFDKSIAYVGDQYLGTLDVSHGEFTYRAAVGARFLGLLDVGLNYEIIDASADADDDVSGTYDLSGTAVYLTADGVFAGESLEGFVGVGLGWFDLDGSIEAFGEAYDPEDPADFEYTPADVSGDAIYLDVHAGVNLDLAGRFFLRPSLEARVLSVSDPEVTIDDSQRPAGVDPRPGDLPAAREDFALDYGGMLVRVSLGYRF